MKNLIWLLLMLLISTATGYALRREVIRLDGFIGEISGLLLTTDTQYAPHYSHRNFAQLKVGMTEQEVIDLVGEPLKRWQPYNKNQPPFTVFQYSQSPSDTHYRLRQVHFGEGRVVEVVSYFYGD